MGRLSDSLTRSVLELDVPISYVDFGGHGSPVVLVHGLGGSVANWFSVAPALSEQFRVFAIDLRGFGNTPRGELPASFQNNRLVLHDFIERVVAEPVSLVGNSMGGVVSMYEAATEPDSVRSLILVDPAIPSPPGVEADPVVVTLFSTYAEKGSGEQLLAAAALLDPADVVRQTLTLCCVDVNRVDPIVIDELVEVARVRNQTEWAGKAFLEAARSLVEMHAEPSAYREVVQAISAPTLLIQGIGDRLIPAESVSALAADRPDWDLELWDDTGHIPQLEHPDRFVSSVSKWLTEHEREVSAS